MFVVTGISEKAFSLSKHFLKLLEVKKIVGQKPSGFLSSWLGREQSQCHLNIVQYVLKSRKGVNHERPYEVVTCI